MDSSDSLKIDENLARFLAAYDQALDGGDAGPPTVQVPLPSGGLGAPAVERAVTPLHGAANEGSMGEVLPDPGRAARVRPTLLDSTPAPLPPGGSHRVGRFELRRQLGKGGCGIVFLAYDPKLEREVALKIPRPEMLLNSDAKRRLMREALAAAEFDHPNLVPVFEAGEIGPVCYIATAFCPGQTLAEWLDRQAFPVPVRQAARLVATVAEAVQHAHDRGVLHRDLKPNNVILQDMKVEENDEPPPGSLVLRGENLLPRLVDFGLAKLVERGGPSETGTRQIVGTPKYMAPEQAQARREDIGPPADVYALGVILYEMIAGRAPYDGATDIEVLRQAIEGKPLAPRALRPDVPRDLEAICLKAMAARTEDRYRTAIDLADDLRRFLEGHPTVARPLAWSGRAYRWLRRNDQIVAIIVLAVIALFVTSLATWNSYQSRQLRKDHDSVLNDQALRNRAEQERAYARSMQDAYLAWRSGNVPAAGAGLDAARRAATMLMEQPDFTHDYLTRLMGAERLMIVCPAGAVTALAVSSDGARLASGHADGTLAVWDRASGKQLGTARAHEVDVSHVCFALGGTRVFTVGKGPAGDEALGWSVARDGAVAPAPGAHRVLGKSVSCLAVSPDGTVVYAGGTGGRLLKIHLTDSKQSASVLDRAGESRICAVAVSPTGTCVLTATPTGTVRSWSADLVARPDGETVEFDGPVTALAATERDSPVVGFATGGYRGALPFTEGDRVPTAERVHWIARAANGSFALNAEPGRVLIDEHTSLATGDTGIVTAGALSRDGKTLFTGSRDGVIRARDVARDARDLGAARAATVTALAVSADGATVLAADRARGVARYTGPGTAERVTGWARPPAAVQVLEDGTVRGVVLDGGTVLVSDLVGKTTVERLRTVVPDGRAASTAALAPDGARVAIGDAAGKVTVWSVPERNLLFTADTGLRRPVRRVAIAPDGRRVAAPTSAGLGVWIVGAAEPMALAADDQAVFGFLPVSDRIATAGRDGVVRVWNAAGREDQTLYGHVGRVTALNVSPDGRTLVSGGATGEVKFWDVRTGQELFGVRRHSVAVTVVEFAAGGKVLVTAGDGQLAVWDARSE